MSKVSGSRQLLIGCLLVLIGLSVGLGAYYTYTMTLRYLSFSLLLTGLVSLFMAMKYDIEDEVKSSLVAWVIVTGVGVLYIALRTQLHRFDFGVGDAADYYIAGVCSVTYSQDIGFFLPLTASVSAVGYSVFESAYAPFINVMVYGASVPISYFLFRKLGLEKWISLFMTILLVLIPLSIWFSKSSFSEPLWQLLLLIFSILFYRISEHKTLKRIDIFALFLLLALVPFLRGEGVLYYGLVGFLSVYHFWKFNYLKSAMLLALGLFVVAVSIHLTLEIRAHYLLRWQFSRIIPNITAFELMLLLYGIGASFGLLLGVMYFWRKRFSLKALPLMLTLFAILFKVAIAYVYGIKKSESFLDLFFFNEYGLALGNFGLPLTVGIGIGLILLHIKAMKGDALSLLFVVMYAIFYLPLVMQGVTFQSPHEVFLYWNRYYFSIFMMIHIFALSLVIHQIYEKSKQFVQSKKIHTLFMGMFMLVTMLFSINLKVEKIVIEEAYLENSDKVFAWIKEKVKHKSISVLYDDAIRYERHNGLYDAKVFTSRMFTVQKINVKAWQKIKINQLNSDITLKKDMFKSMYLVAITSQMPQLKNKKLKLLLSVSYPISWREHYRAQPRSKIELDSDVSQSHKNEVELYLTLYKIDKRRR